MKNLMFIFAFIFFYPAILVAANTPPQNQITTEEAINTLDTNQEEMHALSGAPEEANPVDNDPVKASAEFSALETRDSPPVELMDDEWLPEEWTEIP